LIGGKSIIGGKIPTHNAYDNRADAELEDRAKSDVTISFWSAEGVKPVFQSAPRRGSSPPGQQEHQGSEDCHSAPSGNQAASLQEKRDIYHAGGARVKVE